MGASPTPAGAMTGGVLHDARILADGVRRVLKSYDISGNSAYLALPGRAASSRVLELPKMKDEDLGPVVAGEMEHYRMIPPGQGAFSYIPLGKPTEDKTKILLMAADKRIVDSYREALRGAGVQMEVLEPFSFAAARACFNDLKEGGIALLALDARSTELLIFDNGTLAYSRQIEVGAMDLTDTEQPEKAHAKQADAKGESAAGGESVPRLMESGGHLQTLLFEISRSLDFYHREEPQAARVQGLVLCADQETLSGLDQTLRDELELPVKVCEPLNNLRYSESHFKPEYIQQAGPAFAPAIGLALKALEANLEAPTMDLSVTDQETRIVRAAPKRLAVALVISLILVVAATLASLQLRASLRQRQQELAQTRQDLAEVAKTAQERSMLAQRVREAQEIVQLRGLPWSKILFQIAEFMPEHQSWLEDIKTNSRSTTTLSLEGGAVSADSVATLMDSLRVSPLFGSPKNPYTKKDTSRARQTVKFRIELQVTQPPDIVLQPQNQEALAELEAPGGEPE